MDFKATLMADEKLSIQMVVLSGAIVAVVVIIFELFMPSVPAERDFQEPGITLSADLSFNIIVYCISSALHIILSLFFSFQLWEGIRKMSAQVRFSVKWRILVLSTLFFLFALVLAILMQIDIVSYSHDRTLSILERTAWASFLKPKIPLTDVSWFSMFPLFLIMCGIIFAVIACMWSAIKATDITNNQLQKEEFDRDAVWSEVSMFGVVVASVFVTSTVATTFYLSLGWNLGSNEGYGAFYRNSANGMTILWATCFTMIMIVIVLFPTGKMNEAARLRHREHRVLGKDTERFKFVYGTLSTDRVLKLLAVLFSPVYVAAMRAAIA